MARNPEKRYICSNITARQKRHGTEETIMILADKIARLRKKNGWSQEELAEKMNVSRQAVSKWESAQTVPDLEKILMLANFFGVTTDYLLKDEIESEEFSSGGEDSAVRRLTLAEANEYLALRKSASVRIAAATFLCILSVIPLLILGAMSEIPAYGISETAASAAGLIVLFLFIAAAVAIFVSCSFKNAPYAFLDKEPFDTEYGVTGMVNERQRQYKSTHARCNMIGIILCILSPVPIFAGMAVGSDFAMILAVCGTLLLAGIGAAVIIVTGLRWSSMQKILQSGDYSPAEKKRGEHEAALSAAYWTLATAVYLAWSFTTNNWKDTWIVWPIAGVLFAAVLNLYRLFTKNREN